MKPIKGVEVKKLQIHADSRGMLMEILRSDDKMFKKFGQVYITTALPGVVKAWHFHQKQTDHFTCVHGLARLVLHSDDMGEFNEFVIGTRNPVLISIPPHIHHGFMNIGTEECIMINVPTGVFNYKNPDECRLPWDALHYDWHGRNG